MALTNTKTTISEENYSFLQKYVHERSGIVLDKGKEYLIEARLIPIVRKRSMTDLDSLCALLRATSGEAALRKDVLEAMTTNETLFFRDTAPFDAFKAKVLPELMQKSAITRTISIWSAASSTGQEIYSIAMILLEAGLRDWKLNLYATDYSEQVLEKARAGKYLQIEVNRGLPATYLVKYFERCGLDWQIKPEVRRMVRFEQIDLRKKMTGMGPFDVVFCRNVLIYFDMETKRDVLRQISTTMPKGAYLFMGATESLLNIDCPFDRTQVGSAVLYQRR